MITASRQHEFSYGHRVYNHESKCSNSHGHNGKVTFTVSADELDSIGRIMDFSVIKSRLTEWVEANWDHKFLLYEKDPWVEHFKIFDKEGLVVVPFNPTAENIAAHLLNVVGPRQLANTNVTLVKVELYETSKCSAIAELERGIGNE